MRRRVALRGRAGSTGGDQIADVDFSGGDHAVEGRLDFLEGLGLFQRPDVGLGGGQIGFLNRHAGILGVHVLLGNRVGFEQVVVTRRRGFGEIQVGLGLGHGGLGLA